MTVKHQHFMDDPWAYLDLARATAYRDSLRLANSCQIVNRDFTQILRGQMRDYAKQAVVAARRQAARKVA